VPYSEKIKNEANISSMAVGAIISANQANDIILNKRADLVALGRELLADPQWVYKAATHFNLENAKSFLPDSYSFYLSRRDEFLDRSAKPA
jgi:2,4-dienoyl-CoA reductase-like NADH-dependent reductase (Old Yellow Enzyme family)